VPVRPAELERFVSDHCLPVPDAMLRFYQARLIKALQVGFLRGQPR
jgi:hypothetical protein